MQRFLLFILFFVSSGTILAAENRPNFVWIMTEDNSSHYLKLYQPSGAETPNIESLAKHGLIYDHAFSNAPVCSVARTTLITSCYAPRIGTFHHRKSFKVPMPEGLKMFPAYLREAGYYTTNNSKEDYNAFNGKDVWDDSSKKATWKNRKTGQPFFHVQTFGTSHESSLHFPASDVARKPTKHAVENAFVSPIHPDTKTFRYTHARYLDRIQDIDDQVGKLVSEIEEAGLLESTFIFCFGDHGGVLPRGKGYAYDTGLHVPLVIRVPEQFKDGVDRKLGSRVERFVSFVDFGPTLLNLAGVSVPKQVDGVPFLGPGSQRTTDHDESFGYADRFDEKFDLVRTLRKGDLRYVRNFQPFNFDGLMNNYRYKMAAYQEWRDLFDAGKLNDVQSQFFLPREAEMLFDSANDPYETKNLANDPAYAEQLKSLRASLDQRLKSMPDLGFYPENFLANHAAENPVQFGQEHRQEIAKLVDIANLQLVAASSAIPDIQNALESDLAWARYWGIISATVHGQSAKQVKEKIDQLSQDDPENLVRVRAAEYLALVYGEDVGPQLRQSLQRSRSATEANLILNTVVLLQDGPPHLKVGVTSEDVAHLKTGRGELDRRMEYLLPKK